MILTLIPTLMTQKESLETGHDLRLLTGNDAQVV